MNYPGSYGFIPQTLALDDDPLDVIVYNNTPINSGALVEVTPVATVDMTDNGDKDYKVVSIEEKPSAPKSSYACIGLYSYPNIAIEKAKSLTPSSREYLKVGSPLSHPNVVYVSISVLLSSSLGSLLIRLILSTLLR